MSVCQVAITLLLGGRCLLVQFESEFLRTPFSRTSRNAASRHLGEVLSTAPHPPKPGHIAQTLNAREFACANRCTLQPLVARQCRG